MEYSRDALAAPLKELDRVIELIPSGEFDPDAARSGRWKQPPQEEAESDGSGDTDGHEIAQDVGPERKTFDKFPNLAQNLCSVTSCGLHPPI